MPVPENGPIKINIIISNINAITAKAIIPTTKGAIFSIDFCISNIRQGNEIIIVSGGAKGSDTLGERYAKQNGFEIERYLADWDTYGKSAGARRNKKMAEISDYVICFWDGKSKGTKIMIDYAKQFNKPLKIKKI